MVDLDFLGKHTACLIRNIHMVYPKNPDPSKVANLRTYTPLLYRFKPFHWMVQGFLGQVHYTNKFHTFIDVFGHRSKFPDSAVLS